MYRRTCSCRRSDPEQLPSLHNVRSPFLLLYSCLLFQAVFAEINFIHCRGPADLGGRDVVGKYFNTCIFDERFSNRTHAWNFEHSIIRNTNFTSCGFEDTEDRKQGYGGSTWEDVRFENCHFGSALSGFRSVTRFSETSFRDVVFDSCVFHASAEVIFSSFSLESVTFKNCLFLGQVTLEKGSVNRLTFDKPEFSPYAAGSSLKKRTGFLFSKLNMKVLHLFEPTGGVFRMQASSVEDLFMLGGTPESLICHEKPHDDEPISLAATLTGTIIVEAEFYDGIYCGHGVLNGLEMHDVKIGRNADFINAQILRLAVLNMTSLSADSPGRFSLAHATIRGEKIRGVENIHTTFQGAIFQPGIYLEDVMLSTSSFVLTDTIFTQERINEECCTVACLGKGCKCDVSLEPVTGCPQGNSSVNVNVHDSCFPADSTVAVMNKLSEAQDISVKDLRHGHVVANVLGVDASEVFFFGHRTSSQSALFRVLSGHVMEADRESEKFVISLSPGHVLPVLGRGDITADEVRLGDVLFTSKGERARVTDIKSRVQKGMYAPTTLSGKLSVNGIQVSCYTNTLPPTIAHVSLAPLRAFYRSSRYSREVLRRITILDEKSAGWMVASMRRLAQSRLYKVESFW